MWRHLIAGSSFVRISCLAIASVLVAWEAREVFAVHIATASIGMSYNEIQGNNAGEIVSDPVGDLRQGLGVQKAVVHKTIQFKGATIAFDGTAEVDYGQLKVGSLTLWTISDTSTTQSYRAQNDSTISARWTDVANMEVPGRTSGYLDVRTFLQVSGNMEGTASQTGNPANNNAEGQFQLNLTTPNPNITIENGFGMGRMDVNSFHSNEFTTLPPARIPVRFLYQIGQPFSLDFTLSLHSFGTARAGFADKTDVGLSTDADFTHTVTWGGITQVLDPNNGQVINNWTITSESGFDYSQPYPVPEPSSVSLLAIVGLATAVVRLFRTA